MLALARKYRPRTFADVAVQSHVSNTLRGAIARGRVAHGYLLCGPRGVGKTTLARVLAMALNCDRKPGEGRPADGEPCGECESCRRIWSGSASLDVVEIDAASNRGVDDARDLRERAMYAPSGDERYKVYIVDEAHMLTREAWNALLKVLEEPPPRVVFVFATTEPQKIAQAAAPVLSRLQRFDLKRIGPADVRARLSTVLAAEGVEAHPDALGIIARAADGSMRDALSLTDQALSLGEGALTVERVREALGLVPEDEYLTILDLIAERRAADVFSSVGRLSELGVDLGSFVTGLADMLRAQLAVTLGASSVDVSERARTALEERRGRLSTADLLRMLAALGEMEPRFRKSAQQQLLLEMLLVRFALLDRSVMIEDVLRGLGGEGGGAGATTGQAPPRAADPPPRSDRIATPAVGASMRADARVADRPAPSPLPRVATPLDLNRVVEDWDDVVARVRGAGRNVIASILERAVPVAVTAKGVVTLQVDDEAAEQGIESSKADVLAAVRARFPGVERLAIRRSETSAAPTGARRMSEETVRDERMASLRKRDPVLGAAIDALDLELLD